MSRRRRSLRRLSWDERLLLVRSIALLPWLAWALHRRGLQHTQQRLARRAAASPSGSRDVPEARRVAWIIDVAARRGPWRANCLQRSLALWYVLARRGTAADLRIGVQRDPASPAPAFHAWLELDGVVLNDAPDIGTRFAAFDRVIAPPRGAAFD